MEDDELEQSDEMTKSILNFGKGDDAEKNLPSWAKADESQPDVPVPTQSSQQPESRQVKRKAWAMNIDVGPPEDID